MTASPTSFRLAPVGGAGFSIAGAASAGGFNAAKTLKDPHAWQQQQQQAQVRSLRGPYYDEQGRTAGFHQRANAEAGPSRHPGAAAAGALRERLGQQQRQQASPISSSTATAATSSSWSQEFQRSGGQHHSGPPSDRLQSGDARRLGGSTALEQQQPYAVAQPPQALLRVSNSPSPFGTLGNRPLDRSQLYSSFQSHHLPQPQQHPSEASRAAPPLESSTATDWDWDAEFARLEVAQTDSQRNQLSETAARWAGDAWEQAAYAQDTGAMSGDLPLSPVDRATYLEEQQQRQRRSAAESMTSSARASWEAERKTGMGCSPLSIMQQQQQDGGSDQDTAREIVAAPPESDSDVGLLRFAVPSVSLPTFAPDGRLEGKLGGQRASDAAALARAEGAAAAWEATFERPGSLWAQRDRERGQQPAAAAAEATSSDNTCLVDGEATEVDDALDDHDDPFDDDTFASFYGQVHVASSATTAQAGPAAEAARRARDALDFSDTRFDLVRIEDSRIEGYPLFRQARHGQMAFAGDTDETQRTGRYLFQPGNPYVMGRTVEAGDVVAEMDLGQFGLEYLNVLQHEAAVLARPTDSSAWLSLGLKQQENERDDMAAQALLQCVGLDPMCGQAYLALSVSYTNEGRLREAHDVLERWVDVVNGRPPRESATGSMVEQGLGSGLDAATEPITRESRHRQLAAELIDMVQRGAQGKQGDDVVDADVQVALGVLFNASEVSNRGVMRLLVLKWRSQEYEKSQDCFRTALQVRPDVSPFHQVLLCLATQSLLRRTGCSGIASEPCSRMATGRKRLSDATKRRLGCIRDTFVRCACPTPRTSLPFC